MRNILLLIFLLFTVQSRAQEPPESTISIKVLSWNIQMLPNFFRAFSPSLRKMQAKRLPWIVDYIKSQDFEVIVFQEVFDVECKRRLRRQLKKIYPYQVKPINKGRMTSNGILIVSKHPMKYIDHVVYAKGSGADGMAAKGCVLAELTKGGLTFQLAGTHLQAGSGIAQQHRDQQYKDIRKLLDKNKKENVPQIVAGDMNTRKSEPEVYNRMLKEMDVEDFPLNEEEPFTVDGNNSWNAPDKKGNQIDYVFLRKQESNSTIVQQKVLRPRKKTKGMIIDLADHYGIMTDLKVESTVESK
jgi:endonuclease/exonuclease/phosphatase family metal-dependent hydrolase